jgi:tetratricopeptide (TPR) repeat protein
VQTYSGLRRFGDSERVVNAALARLRGASTKGVLLVQNEAALAMGNAEGARAALDSIHNKDDMDYQSARLWLYAMERDYSGAKALAAKATDEVKRMPSFWLIIAMVAHAQGNLEEAHQANEEAKRITLASLLQRPDNPEALGELAFAEAALGRKEEALRNARRAAEILPPSVDAVAGPMCENRLAQVLAVTGDRDGAFDKLSKLVKVPFGLNYGDLKLNPMWDDLRDDPRFDRILAESALPLATNG